MSWSTSRGSTFARRGRTLADSAPNRPVTRSMRASASQNPPARIASSTQEPFRRPQDGSDESDESSDEDEEDEEQDDDDEEDDDDPSTREQNRFIVKALRNEFNNIKRRLQQNVEDIRTGAGVPDTITALRELSQTILVQLPRHPDRLANTLVDIIAYMADDADVYANSALRPPFVGGECRLARAFLTTSGSPTTFVQVLHQVRVRHPGAFQAQHGRLGVIYRELLEMCAAIQEARSLPASELAHYHHVLTYFRHYLLA